MPDARPMKPVTLADQVQDLRREVTHWKIEAQQAFKERDAAKKSLVAAGGPVVYWRDRAVTATTDLARTNEHVGKLRQQLTDERLQVANHSKELDALKARIEDHRQAFWKVWSELEDGHPLKQQFWDVWVMLA